MNKAREITLAPEFISIFALEAFILADTILGGDRKNCILIMATELFDNIIRHAQGLKGDISFRMENGDDMGCRFFISYKSSNFGELVTCCSSSGLYYDEKLRLYRGLGLVMCRNLALEIGFEPGPETDRIIVSL
ncbi:MAG: hypothetical protein LBR47_07520 [Spirochaetaceae bacterium]|jgi:two-component sensor histidine kinase|nr:hypothetical protein [Spirochaetaceae bacterium]